VHPVIINTIIITKPVVKIWDSDKSDWVEVGFVQLK